MLEDINSNTPIHHILTYCEAGNVLDAEGYRSKQKQKYLSHGASLQVSVTDSKQI